MDADGLKALFEPFGSVTVKRLFGGHGVYAVAVKRMFGGHGVYAEGLCFAIEHGGGVFLKVDAESQAAFVAAGVDADASRVRRGRIFAVRLQRPRQGHADVVLAPAASRPRRGGGAQSLGRART